jgi:hypothetical protein
MPCASPTLWSRSHDLRDQVLAGAYCDSECLLMAHEAFKRFAGRPQLPVGQGG